MSLNLLIFLIFYFLIINSTIGYGYLISSVSRINFKHFEHSYLGLLGIFFLIIVSYTSHIFISHNYIHNFLILLIGLIYFLYFIFKDKKKINILKLNTFFLILFIAFITFKPHDDFSYYHFQYTYYLTQSDILIGVGNFNHGFRTPSSIFYLNSLFYLPIIKYFFFHMGAILVMGFTSYSFLEKILEQNRLKIYDKYFYLSILFFMFCIIFFYRISEHGTDRSAQILIFLMIINLLRIINLQNGIVEQIAKIIIILGLVISLKAFYILYIIITLPVFYYFIKDKKYDHLFLIFKNLYFFLFLILLVNLLLVNLANSGCFIYPVSFTCFEFFSWSIPLSEVSLMNDWYEQWSKAGANPNFRVENPKEYIAKLNWVTNWFDEYFFTKVSDFLLGILLLMLILFITFYSNSKYTYITLKGENLIYIILIILFLEWFYNHPSLRYGGYQLICLLLFLPFSGILISKKKIKNIYLKINVLIFITLVIFFGRNINRLVNENIKYDYNPLDNPVYRITEDYFKIQKKFQYIIQNKNVCDANETAKNCDKNIKIDVKENYGYKIFYRT